jgi:hypothetical protein
MIWFFNLGWGLLPLGTKKWHLTRTHKRPRQMNVPYFRECQLDVPLFVCTFGLSNFQFLRSFYDIIRRLGRATRLNPTFNISA